MEAPVDDDGAGTQELSAEGAVPDFEIDLATVVAIWMGGVLVLVPLLGLTVRFGLTPLLDAAARVRTAGAARRSAEVEERFAVLDARVAELTLALERLADAEESRHAPMA